jgi:hypothetical protein
VQVPAPAPQTTGWLFAVCPDVAELLAVVRALWDLYASILIAMWQRLGRWKISWDFAVLGKVTRKRGRFIILDSSGGDRRVVVMMNSIFSDITTCRPLKVN